MKSFYILCIPLLAISFASCGKKSDSDEENPDSGGKNSNTGSSGPTGKVNLNFKSNSMALVQNGFSLAGNATYSDLPISTSAATTGLSSMKMYFREIKLCTNLKFNSGTGFTFDGPCATVYENLTDEYSGTVAPTAADRTRFSAAGEGKFYDVLLESDRAKLNRGVSIPVGEYNYGIIETHPWVKIVAKNGTLCTKAAGAKENESVGGDGIKTYSTSVTSVTCGASEAAEEVLTFITNANSSFKFLKPFVVGENQEVTIDLAFNLDSEIKTISNTSTVPGGMTAADGSGSFYVPMIRMGAAPRNVGETTKVETYLLGTASNKERIRAQLYYNSADTAKTILGVNFTVLATASSTKTKANNPIYGTAITQTGDVVSVKSWDGTDLLSFTRGVSGTATIVCVGSGGSVALEECSGKQTNTLTYEAPTVANL